MKFPKVLTIGLLSLGTIAITALPSMARPGFIHSEANLRSGPSTESDRIDSLPEGTPLEVLRMVVGTNHNMRTWYYVRSTGTLRTEGWITSSLVRFKSSNQNYGTLAGNEGDVINIRSTPNLWSQVIHRGENGDLVSVGESKFVPLSSDAVRTGHRWYNITYPNGTSGWVRGDLINLWNQSQETPVTQSSTSLKIPALKKEMTYEVARQLIINAGWQPLFTTTDNPHDGTKSRRDRGYNEVTSCSGTGMGFCRFEFTGAGDRKLVIVTGGRESTVQKWWEEKVDRTPPAKQSNLPFVGRRAFNFLGGSGTGYSITIESNGNTIIQLHGTMSSSTVYQGPFQETMEGIKIKDGYADTCDQQRFTTEGEPIRCRTELYEVKR